MSDAVERIGAYRLGEVLGRGGMGAVYRAVHEPTGRTVALKVLAHGLGEDQDTLRRFELELAALSRLDHDGVTRALGPMERDAGRVYFPLELVEGRTLRALLDAAGPLPLDRAVRIARAIFEALAAAHGVGVVHRDVKPSNVLVAGATAADGSDVVKVADFGLARLVDATRVTASGQVMGTLHYMSPEQCEGSRSVDARADLYGAGVVLYEMLAGRPPFSADTPVALLRAHMVTPPPPIEHARADVPPELARFLADCLAKRPDERIQTAIEAVERLDALPRLADTCTLVPKAIQSELPTRVEMQHSTPATAAVAPPADATTPATPPVVTVQQSPPRRLRLPVGGWVVVAAFVAALAVAGFFVFGRGGQGQERPETDSTAELWQRVGAALETRDLDAFRACLAPDLRSAFGSGTEANARFTEALADVDTADLRPGAISGDLGDDGRLRVQIVGAALPAALGIEDVDAENGLALRLERIDGAWRIESAANAPIRRRAAGDPVARAADAALRNAIDGDRLANVLGRSDLDRLSPQRRAKLRAWLDAQRAADAPPDVRYELDPETFDPVTRVWVVVLTVPSLAAALEEPDAKLELTLAPAAAGGRGGARGAGKGQRFRVAGARIVR